MIAFTRRCRFAWTTLGVAALFALSLAGGTVRAHDDQATSTPAAAGHDHDTAADAHAAHDTADAPSDDERAAADRLLAATKTGVARFADVAVAEAEGYVQITPFSFYGVRAAHFHNETYDRDGELLDPARPEDLMYLKAADGRLTLIGVMYLAPAGEGPRPGGPLTNWHTHPDLCASEEGVTVIEPSGACPPGTAPITAEMLHVWLVENPDGPFADRLPADSGTTLMDADATGNSAAAGTSLFDWTGMVAAIGDVLDLNPLALRQRFEAGESLAEMATAQGIERRVLESTIARRFVADYDRAVAAGDMTPGQRDLFVRAMPAQVRRFVEIHRGESWLIDAASPAPTPGA